MKPRTADPIADVLWEEYRTAGRVVRSFPCSGPMGLPTDAEKANPERIAAKARAAAALDALRNHNKSRK